MKIEGDATLVLAGAWNPAIVTPSWIGKHVFKYSLNHEFQVGMMMPIQGLGGAPTFTFEDITIQARPDCLLFTFNAADAAKVKACLHVASEILKLLAHTPVTALGVNLRYSLAGQSKLLRAALNSAGELAQLVDDAETKVAKEEWSASLNLSDHLMNVSCLQGSEHMEVSFNHHFEVPDALKAAAICADEGLIDRLRKLSESLVAKLERETA